MAPGPVGIPLISAEENTPFLLGGKSLLASLVNLGSGDNNDEYNGDNEHENENDFTVFNSNTEKYD
jgi:hypothetical protein